MATCPSSYWTALPENEYWWHSMPKSYVPAEHTRHRHEVDHVAIELIGVNIDRRTRDDSDVRHQSAHPLTQIGADSVGYLEAAEDQNA